MMVLGDKQVQQPNVNTVQPPTPPEHLSMNVSGHTSSSEVQQTGSDQDQQHDSSGSSPAPAVEEAGASQPTTPVVDGAGAPQQTGDSQPEATVVNGAGASKPATSATSGTGESPPEAPTTDGAGASKPKVPQLSVSLRSHDKKRADGIPLEEQPAPLTEEENTYLNKMLKEWYENYPMGAEYTTHFVPMITHDQANKKYIVEKDKMTQFNVSMLRYLKKQNKANSLMQVGERINQAFKSIRFSHN
jgi:hypothetical protein